jgi:hypothetical protein
MNNALVRAVLESGLVDGAALQEVQRWGVPIEAVEVQRPSSLEELDSRIMQALESEGYALVRETDLEILRYYTTQQTDGLLFLAECPEADVHPPIQVSFARLPTSEYILPWRSEGISGLLCNGASFLLDGPRRVFFRDVRELFFGDTKAFLVCVVDGQARQPGAINGDSE